MFLTRHIDAGRVNSLTKTINLIKSTWLFHFVKMNLYKLTRWYTFENDTQSAARYGPHVLEYLNFGLALPTKRNSYLFLTNKSK